MSQKYVLTVNIESAGTAIEGGGSSTAGHMWYKIDVYDDNGFAQTPLEYGFAPNKVRLYAKQ
jgi:hypothetical protein